MINYWYSTCLGFFIVHLFLVYSPLFTRALPEPEKSSDTETTSTENDCGSPEMEIFTECVGPYSFPNCQSFAVPVRVEDISVKQKLNLHKSTHLQSVRVEIEWKIPRAGNSDIWGWQLIVSDLNLRAGASSCVQVNKRYLRESKDGNRYVSYTYPIAPFGTKINISIQSLPAMDKTRVNKTIEIKDQVEKVNIEQVDPTSVKIKLPVYRNISSVLTGYDVFFKSHSNLSCHSGAFRSSLKEVLNSSSSYLMINKLRSSCQNYTVKIRPVFTSSWCDKCFICERFSKGGLFSKYFVFQLNNNHLQGVPISPKPSSGNLTKALVVVTAVIAFSLVVVIFLGIQRRKIVLRKDMETEEIQKEKPVTEIFIAHSNHCKECETVALSVATYLNMTGHCRCFLDLCSLPSEWSLGKTQYYENEIRKRHKVIIMCSVSEDQERQDNPAGRNFVYQKNLMRSEILVNCTTTKFIPVYMDFSSDLDVPCFLRNLKSFSLPSQLMDLVLYAIEQPLRKPISVGPLSSIQESDDLVKQKKIVEAKIKNMKLNHQKYFKYKNNSMITKLPSSNQC